MCTIGEIFALALVEARGTNIFLPNIFVPKKDLVFDLFDDDDG